MTIFLLGIVARQIFNQERPRSNHSHVALEDVEQFGKLVEAGGAEELAVGVQPHVVGEQVPLGVTLVGHGAELDELEDFLVKTRARLCKERIAFHLEGAKNREYDENRAQADDGCQSAEKIQNSF